MAMEALSIMGFDHSGQLAPPRWERRRRSPELATSQHKENLPVTLTLLKRAAKEQKGWLNEAADPGNI